MPKKQLLIIGIAVLLVCVGLSGCTQNSSKVLEPTERSPCYLAGKWIWIITTATSSSLTYPREYNYSLIEDYNFTNSTFIHTECSTNPVNPIFEQENGTYEIKNGYIILTNATGGPLRESLLQYSISDDCQTLTLKHELGYTLEYKRLW